MLKQNRNVSDRRVCFIRHFSFFLGGFLNELFLEVHSSQFVDGIRIFLNASVEGNQVPTSWTLKFSNELLASLAARPDSPDDPDEAETNDFGTRLAIFC